MNETSIILTVIIFAVGLFGLGLLWLRNRRESSAGRK